MLTPLLKPHFTGSTWKSLTWVLRTEQPDVSALRESKSRTLTDLDGMDTKVRGGR